MHQKSQRCPWRAPIILLLSLPCSFLQAGVLQDYVYRADPAYRYQLALTQPGKGYILTMVSQQWRTLDEVNRAEWNHRIHLAVPDSPSSSTALLYIEGGDNNDSFPQGLDSTITLLAEATNTIVAMVEMVPNQPLRFTDETRSR
ncbi:MAG: hypothetical protein JW828_14975, partial [Sedimentisphaerales bacterium]|nr:hypothetical protein [Sedimentisphaerales bacterium]